MVSFKLHLEIITSFELYIIEICLVITSCDNFLDDLITIYNAYVNKHCAFVIVIIL